MLPKHLAIERCGGGGPAGDLQTVMFGLSIGDAITVVVDRDGVEVTVEATLKGR